MAAKTLVDRVQADRVQADRALVGLALSVLLLGVGMAPCEAAGPTSPLPQELERLRREGMPLIFSSSVVRPEMRVAAKPAGVETRAWLERALGELDLELVESEAGALVVTPRTLRTVLVGLASNPPPSDRPEQGKASTEACSVQWQGPVEGKVACTYPGEVKLSLPPGRYVVRADVGGHLPAEAELWVGRSPPGLELRISPLPQFLESLEVLPRAAAVLPPSSLENRISADSEIVLEAETALADPLRLASWTPGVSSVDGDAKLWMRGGYADQVMVRLDGYEIEEPYILTGFLSKVSTHLVGQTKVLPGAFPAEYGERLGVVDMTSREVGPEGRLDLSYGLLHAHLDASAELALGRFHFGFRIDQFRLSESLYSIDAVPRFRDLYLKSTWDLESGGSLRATALDVRDALGEKYFDPFADVMDREDVSLDGWLDLLLPSRVGWISTRAGAGRRLHERFAYKEEPVHLYELGERRRSEQGVVRQLVTSELGEHRLRWGWSLRRDYSAFDLTSDWSIYGPLARLRSNAAAGELQREFESRERQLGFHFSDAWNPTPRVQLETGLRFDRTETANERHWSPRLLLRGSLGGQTLPDGLGRGAPKRDRAWSGSWHVGWGRYVQGHRPHEIALLDSETELSNAELTERWVLGLRGRWASSIAFSAEAYSNRNRRPRPRYWNLFAPNTLIPELKLDRYRWHPESSRTYGLDLYLARDRPTLPVRSWLAISISESRDRLDGGKVYRSPVDAPWTVRAGLRWDIRAWSFDLRAEFREGLPTTSVQVEKPEGSATAIPIAVELAGSRVPEYHRLDLDLGRRWQAGPGELELSFHVHNLLNRQNIVGYNFDLSAEGNTGQLTRQPENWGFRAILVTLRWSL